MSKSKDIFKALIQEDVLTAKKLIKEALLEKLGSSLEEKLVNFAPSVFSEGNPQNTQESTDYDQDLEEISPSRFVIKHIGNKLPMVYSLVMESCSEIF